MPRISADFVNPPKPGGKSASVKSGQDLYFYDPKKFTFDRGSSYEVTTRTSEYQGRAYTYIETAKQIGGGSGGGDRWWMPFVSNTVAHAIAAQRIAQPDDIEQWARAARDAALSLEEEEKKPDGDEEIPF